MKIENALISKPATIEKSDRAMIFNGRVNDVREKGEYLTSDIDAFAVIHNAKQAEEMEGLVEARNLLEHNKIVTVEDYEVTNLFDTIRRNLEVKNNFMQTKLLK